MTEYQTSKAEVIADIAIAMMATVFLFTCWGKEGWLFNAGLLWSGMQFGYLITVYLNGDYE
jgi:hypothetical protein